MHRLVTSPIAIAHRHIRSTPHTPSLPLYVSFFVCHHSLVKFSRVIDDEICFPAKEAFNLYELFHTRYMLFKTIYVHRASKAIELMITDILVAAGVAALT